MKTLKYKDFLPNYRGDLYLGKPRISGKHYKIRVFRNSIKIKGENKAILRNWLLDKNLYSEKEIFIYGFLGGKGLGRKKSAVNGLKSPVFFVYALCVDKELVIEISSIRKFLDDNKNFCILPVLVRNVNLNKDIDKLKQKMDETISCKALGIRGLQDGMIMLNQETKNLEDNFLIDSIDSLNFKLPHPKAEEMALRLATPKVLDNIYKGQSDINFFRDVQKFIHSENVKDDKIGEVPWRDISKFIHIISKENLKGRTSGIRVLKRGENLPPENYLLKFSCSTCKSKIEARVKDRKFLKETPSGWIVIYECPCCGNETNGYYKQK